MRPVTIAQAGTHGGSPDEADVGLQVRPPRQARTLRAWNRVLDCGVQILEDGGYDAFTIAAVCDRAHVPPRALYARVTSKDGLFLAVYEHAMARVAADHAPFTDDTRWDGLGPAATIEQAVRLVLAIFARHARLLRAVVLISSAHPEIYKRGARYSRQLQDLYVERCGPAVSRRHPNPGEAAAASFDAVFSSAIFRTAYGPDFLAPGRDDSGYATRLADMQVAYLTAERP
jgi:AcrR family transcriptional regulator